MLQVAPKRGKRVSKPTKAIGRMERVRLDGKQRNRGETILQSNPNYFPASKRSTRGGFKTTVICEADWTGADVLRVDAAIHDRATLWTETDRSADRRDEEA